jgi:D-alanine-D-alanine ligase
LVESFCDQFVPEGALVVKPTKEGSSVGVQFCTAPGHKFLTADEVVSTINVPIKCQRLDKIVECVEATFALDDQIIVQRKVVGTEITVGVLQCPDPEALPVVEIVTPADAWYDYDHKYAVGGSEHIIPARVPAPWLEFAQRVAVQLHRQLGCRDYSRIDFILEGPGPDVAPTSLCFLEANTLPGFTQTSLFPDAARAAGYAMPSLVKRLVLQAWERRGAGGIAEPNL